jgi:hypothetical protein
MNTLMLEALQASKGLTQRYRVFCNTRYKTKKPQHTKPVRASKHPSSEVSLFYVHSHHPHDHHCWPQLNMTFLFVPIEEARLDMYQWSFADWECGHTPPHAPPYLTSYFLVTLTPKHNPFRFSKGCSDLHHLLVATISWAGTFAVRRGWRISNRRGGALFAPRPLSHEVEGATSAARRCCCCWLRCCSCF